MYDLCTCITKYRRSDTGDYQIGGGGTYRVEKTF